MSKLFCKYCKRFCDERCLHCSYMKEAELKEEEEKEDEEETEKRPSKGSRGASDAATDIRRLLSSVDTDKLAHLEFVIACDIVDRLSLESYVTLVFGEVFANLKTFDPEGLYKIQDELLKYIKHEKEEKEVER